MPIHRVAMDKTGVLAEMNVSYVPSEPGEAVLAEGETLSAQDASDGLEVVHVVKPLTS